MTLHERQRCCEKYSVGTSIMSCTSTCGLLASPILRVCIQVSASRWNNISRRSPGKWKGMRISRRKPGALRFATQCSSFPITHSFSQHDRLNVERRVSEHSNADSRQSVIKTSDVARLMELFQACYDTKLACISSSQSLRALS